MKVVLHNDFLQTYTNDPAAAPGRLEPIFEAVRREGFDTEEALPAGYDDILRVHTERHIQSVTRQGLYNIAALAAGGAIQAAEIGLEEPCFAVIRPPGHHASADSSWGFCFFNNMAVALEYLRAEGKIKSAYVLDFDLHFGDGTVNILQPKGYVTIFNPDASTRKQYLESVEKSLSGVEVDIIGISAGFDNHVQDWGGLLETEDYHSIGLMVHKRCQEVGCGCFAVLEGGYNHSVLAQNVVAFIKGLNGREF
ncbi:MAG TPA: histone deacetylase family protein [Thermodesulforhabdus norvegica]|uniref:Histone deacetylase family protein n=1 Tax=Thermodesulforhabdus norvegica TaxID=39841 RepID=A0A7C1B203_9BACT|nr:histone deacetylase family protein [Deltaproteobacteria bacterium]MBW2067420.1 histone deacetylase family protein [Deltaproteobacteria bacterium]HDL90361.1 histone deacetylase family protein [Thermodesulforhabdus norvegica]